MATQFACRLVRSSISSEGEGELESWHEVVVGIYPLMDVKLLNLRIRCEGEAVLGRHVFSTLPSIEAA